LTPGGKLLQYCHVLFSACCLLSITRPNEHSSTKQAEKLDVLGSGQPENTQEILLRKGKQKRGAGSSKRRGRSGVERQQQKVGSLGKHDDRLWAHARQQGVVIRSSYFSIQLHASRSATGWQGQPPPPLTEQEIMKLYDTGEIRVLIQSFLPISFDMGHR
jgi:hypothetical protein